jgi:hypothetical protein
VLTTFASYRAVSSHRQAEIFAGFRAGTVEFGTDLMMGLDLLCYYDHRIETDRRKKAGVTIL